MNPPPSLHGKAIGKGRRRTLLEVISFLFGLSMTTNVAYLFKVGNTCVYVGYVFAFIMLAVLLLAGRDEISKFYAQPDRSVLLFAGLASLSVLTALIGSIVGVLPEGASLVTIRGLVVLACGLTVYYVVLRMGELRNRFMAGVVFGLLLNVIASVLQQVAFNAGSFFTLYYLFPQESFSVSVVWDAWGSLPSGAGRLSYFRPQGLFLEPSHLMIFLVCFAPVAFKSVRGSLARVAIVLGTTYCCVYSQSPNVVFLVVEVIALLLISRRDVRTPISKKKISASAYLVSLVVIFAAVVFVLIHPELITRGLDLLGVAFSDLDVSSSTDTGTVDRWSSMMKALAAAVSYPLGTGWNTESPVLRYLYGFSDVASHSYAIRLLIELGVIGLAAYVYMIYRHARGLVAGHGGKISAYLGLAVVFLFVCQATNGMTLVPWAWALLGLARAEQLEMQGGGANGRP